MKRIYASIFGNQLLTANLAEFADHASRLPAHDALFKLRENGITNIPTTIPPQDLRPSFILSVILSSLDHGHSDSNHSDYTCSHKLR